MLNLFGMKTLYILQQCMTCILFVILVPEADTTAMAGGFIVHLFINSLKKEDIMGTVKSGILSKVSGKVGKVVGSNWNGIEYLRSMPSQYKDAKTEEQIWYRARFSKLSGMLQIFAEIIQTGFKAEAVRKTAYNAAFSYNYQNALSEEFPEVSVDLSKLLLSKGKLNGAENATAVSNDPATLSVSWDDNSGRKWAQTTDKTMLVVYHPEIEDAWVNLNVAERSAAAAEVVLPQIYSGAEVHVYLAFSVKKGAQKGKAKGISNSSYLGTVNIA